MQLNGVDIFVLEARQFAGGALRYRRKRWDAHEMGGG
jgi:hypothetical protein